jgi:outer membrane protein
MMTFNRQILVLLSFVAAAWCMPANAQEFKVGFVNTDRIFREANIAKASQTKLEAEFSKREKEPVPSVLSVRPLPWQKASAQPAKNNW